MRIVFIAIAVLGICGLGCYAAWLIREADFSHGIPALGIYVLGLKWAWQVSL